MSERKDWIAETLAEESLRPVEEKFPGVPEATIDPEDVPQRVTFDMTEEARRVRERGRRPSE